jgi:zinc transport system substrate-binding protein
MCERLTRWVFAVLLATLWLAGCGSNEEPATAEEALQITVSILPQKYFVERVGGSYVDVNVMVAPGNSPATYEPKPEQLAALSAADAYMSIGVPFESAWLDRIAAANSEMMMVDTAQGIEKVGNDPHIWLAPELVKVQSQNIYEALVVLDPAHEATFKANLNAFDADIEALQGDIQETLTGLVSDKFMVFHPAWGYFAREFGLQQIPVEVGGQEPSAAELAALIQTAREEGIQVILAQPEFSTQDAETIAQEIDGEVLLISPLSPDWLSNMRDVAETFAEVLNR